MRAPRAPEPAGVMPAAQEQRGAGEPELVETYVRQSRFTKEQLGRGSGNGTEVQRFAHHGTKDEALNLP